MSVSHGLYDLHGSERVRSYYSFIQQKQQGCKADVLMEMETLYKSGMSAFSCICVAVLL
jgi:hypothetical protein